MNIKMIPFDFVCHSTHKMLKTDRPIFLQNMNMIGRQFFLQFKKSTTFWDNPRMRTVVSRCNSSVKYTFHEVKAICVIYVKIFVNHFFFVFAYSNHV